jgi:hypothetical protein
MKWFAGVTIKKGCFSLFQMPIWFHALMEDVYNIDVVFSFAVKNNMRSG